METQASSHPQPQPLTLKPLGPLGSPPCSADGGCHEVVPTDHCCPCRDPVEFTVWSKGPPDPALGPLAQTPSSSQGQVRTLQLPGVSQPHTPTLPPTLPVLWAGGGALVPTCCELWGPHSQEAETSQHYWSLPKYLRPRKTFSIGFQNPKRRKLPNLN